MSLAPPGRGAPPGKPLSAHEPRHTLAARDSAAATRQLEGKIAEARRRVDDLASRLEAAVDADEAARASARIAEQRAYIRGVVAEHLRSGELLPDEGRQNLEAEIARLESELEELDAQVNPEAMRRRVDERLDAVAVKMTEWARQLDLEWADQGLVRIDRSQLTVAVQKIVGRTLLQQIGSGAHHVGYHVVAHLALHDFFVQRARPVPRCFFLDQPSLPFFPAALAEDAFTEDVDWNAVRDLLILCRDVVEGLGGELQVIVTDHASYAGEPWFDAALVADWHHGERLVPDDWPGVNG